MNRQQKEELVDVLRASFSGSKASFLLCYRGLRVDQMQALRGKLREENGSFKVAKARLMKLAVDGVPGVESLAPYLKDQIGVAFAADDPAAIAKLLSNFAKENKELQVVVGCMDAALLDPQAVQRIATLPSREVLLAQVLGGIQAPVSSFAGVLRVLLLRLLWTLRQVAEKKS